MIRFLALILLPFSLFSLSPQEIIQKADEVRNPSDNYYLDVQVTSSDSSPSRFHVAVQGNNKTRIETIEPARDRGRNLLMLEENMWVFIPNLKREVRVSLNQKLTGQAANGDISRMRWAEDYTPTIESENDDEWVIRLDANKKGLTYDKLRVWIKKGSFHPTKGEYLTSAGKLLKKVRYQGYKELAGRVRPSQIIIHDAVREGQLSTINIQQMEVKNFPNSIFNKRELGSKHL